MCFIFYNSEMDQNIKIAVLGGGGRTGRYLVNHLLSRGYHVKVLLRAKPERPQMSDNQFPSNLSDPHLEIVKGDAVVYADIRNLLSGCEAVISTLGQRAGEPMVASRATTHILSVMDEFAIRRYILVAGINVDTPTDQKGPKTKAATEWMKGQFPEIHEDRARAYDLLSESSADWTIVRLPMITYSMDLYPVATDTSDCPGETIGAASVAVFLEEQLWDRTYISKAPFLYHL